MLTDEQKWEVMQLIQTTNVHTAPSPQTLEMLKDLEAKMNRLIEIMEQILKK